MMAELPESRGIFEVTIRRPAGMKLGVDLQQVPILDSTGLRILRILPGGVIDAHNQSCATADVLQVGDTLLSLGVPRETSASSLMWDFLSRDAIIKANVVRGCQSGGTNRHSAAALSVKSAEQLDAFKGTAASAASAGAGTGQYATNSTWTGADAASAYTSQATWCSECSVRPSDGVAPNKEFEEPAISKRQKTATVSAKKLDLGQEHWVRILSQPVGSLHESDVCEAGTLSVGHMRELPPLELILDGFGAAYLVESLPDFTIEELLAVVSKMPQPPAIDEVIESHTLFHSMHGKTDVQYV